MSKIREGSREFSNLEVKDNSNYAGIIVFDMETEEIVGKILYHSTVEEIFDVKVMNFQKPAIISSSDDRSKQIIYFSNQVFWKKPK